MKYTKLITVGFVLMLSSTGNLYAASATAKRCEVNSLSPEEARSRFAWLKKCPQGRELLIAHAIDMAKDEVRYMSDDEIIDYLADKWIWDTLSPGKAGEKVLRTQPDYVLLETPDGTLWKDAPKSEEVSCDVAPAKLVVSTICRSSCYHPDTALLFPEGEQAIAAAHALQFKEIMVVGEDSTLTHIQPVNQSIDFFIESEQDTQHHLIKLLMQSGKVLFVTANHPLVTGDGVMHQARELSLGDSLIRIRGQKDPIVSLDKDVPYFGKVHNVKTMGQSPISQIVFAEGYLSGSDWYQNEALSLINSRIMRRNIADSLDHLR